MFDQLLPAVNLQDPVTERAWGRSVVFRELVGSGSAGDCHYKEKVLVFKPGHSITLESHSRFSEIWIGDRDYAYVLEDESGVCQYDRATAYERIYVAAGKKHKIINDSTDNLTILELRIGIISEDDKVQYAEDDKW